MHRILVVDDDDNIGALMQRILRGHHVDALTDGEQALETLKRQPYDLMLLDIHMQPVDGMQVMAQARSLDPDLVIIVLTAHGSMESAVEAVRQGAYDYLFKSDPDQVVQRVSAGLHHREQTLLKRRLLTEIQRMSKLVDEIAVGGPMSAEERFVRDGGLTLDVQRRSAMLDGRQLDLTAAEFDMLAKLVSAAPSPVPVAELVASLGYQFVGAAENVGQWHIHNLRKKVGHKRIRTLRGQGYVWVD